MKEIENNDNWIRDKKENFEYFSPSPNIEDYPIVASTLQYRADYENFYDDLLKLKDGGFNVVSLGSLSYAEAPIYSLLTNPLGVKVNLIFHNSTFFSIESNFNDANDSKNFGGFIIGDEPFYSQLVADRYTEKARFYVDQYYDIMRWNPKHLVYINLVGGPCDNTEDHSYKEYVEAYQNNFKPSFFCYDLYPISEISNILYENIPSSGSPDKPEGMMKINYKQFYESFNIFLELSKTTNRPFWAFCESMCFIPLGNREYHRPVAKENYLRFEAFNAIAFGAKGIQYWTYAMRDNNEKETYFSALLDRRGNKTASYYYAQKVNAEIRNFQHIFLNSEIQEITEILPGQNKSLGFIGINVSVNHLIETTEDEFGKGVLCSQIVANEKRYLLIVSKNALDYQEISISMSLLSSLKPLTPSTSNGILADIIYTKTTISQILIPGGYCLFEYNNPSFPYPGFPVG